MYPPDLKAISRLVDANLVRPFASFDLSGFPREDDSYFLDSKPVDAADARLVFALVQFRTFSTVLHQKENLPDGLVRSRSGIIFLRHVKGIPGRREGHYLGYKIPDGELGVVRPNS